MCIRQVVIRITIIKMRTFTSGFASKCGQTLIWSKGKKTFLFEKTKRHFPDSPQFNGWLKALITASSHYHHLVGIFITIIFVVNNCNWDPGFEAAVIVVFLTICIYSLCRTTLLENAKQSNCVNEFWLLPLFL